MRNGRNRVVYHWALLITGMLAALCLSLLGALPYSGAEGAESEGTFEQGGGEEASARAGGLERRHCQGRKSFEGLFLKNLFGRHICSVFSEEGISLRVYANEEFLLARARGLLSPAERGLLDMGGEGDIELVREMKLKLLESIMPGLKSEITTASGLGLGESYVSYSPAADELVLIIDLANGRGGRGNGSLG